MAVAQVFHAISAILTVPCAILSCSQVGLFRGKRSVIFFHGKSWSISWLIFGSPPSSPTGFSSLKLTFPHLKMDGWKMKLPWKDAIFSGVILVFPDFFWVCVIVFFFGGEFFSDTLLSTMVRRLNKKMKCMVEWHASFEHSKGMVRWLVTRKWGL